MDPVTLAVVTTGLSHLALKATEGTVSEAGKDLWAIVREKLGWTADPKPDSLAVRIAERLQDDSALTSELAELLRSKPDQAGTASLLVGRIKAGKVVVAGTVNVSGDFRM